MCDATRDVRFGPQADINILTHLNALMELRAPIMSRLKMRVSGGIAHDIIRFTRDSRSTIALDLRSFDRFRDSFATDVRCVAFHARS